MFIDDMRHAVDESLVEDYKAHGASDAQLATLRASASAPKGKEEKREKGKEKKREKREKEKNGK